MSSTLDDAPAGVVETTPEPPLGWRGVLVLLVVVTLAILPAMGFARLIAREVSQYHASTYEVYAREALAAGRPADTVKICTGALKSSLGRSDHWGMAHLLRAKAYEALGDTTKMLDELNAAATFWGNKYYFARDEDRAEIEAFGSAAGDTLLGAGKTSEALLAYSAAGSGSGEVVGYLYDLAARLDPAQRGQLWPAGTPYLIARRFADPEFDAPLKVVDEQGRNVETARIDLTMVRAGMPSSLLGVSAGNAAGRSWYAVPVYIRLSERPFGVRVVARAEEDLPFGIDLGFWFETAQRSANVGETNYSPDAAEGWRDYALQRDFYQEQLVQADQGGYLVSDGIINRVILNLPPGPANRYWLNAVEVFLPAGA